MESLTLAEARRSGTEQSHWKSGSDLSRQDDKPNPPIPNNELRAASFLPDSGTLHGSSAHGGTAWTGRPIPRHLGADVPLKNRPSTTTSSRRE